MDAEEAGTTINREHREDETVLNGGRYVAVGLSMTRH